MSGSRRSCASHANCNGALAGSKGFRFRIAGAGTNPGPEIVILQPRRVANRCCCSAADRPTPWMLRSPLNATAVGHHESRQTRRRKARPPALGHNEPRRRAPNTRAGAKARHNSRLGTHLPFANCAHADPPTACKIAANDPVGAEVHAGLGLPPGTDDSRKRCRRLSNSHGNAGWLNCLRRCRRQRRALDCCGRVRRPFGVATTWLPDVLDSHTAQKEEVGRRCLPSRIVGRERGGWGWTHGAVTPKLRIRWRGPRKRRLSGLASGR